MWVLLPCAWIGDDLLQSLSDPLWIVQVIPTAAGVCLPVVLIRFASSKPNSPIFLIARVSWKLLPLLFHVRLGLGASQEIAYSIWFVVCMGELAIEKLEI